MPILTSPQPTCFSRSLFAERHTGKKGGKEMVTTFLNTLKDPYYAHLIGHTTSSFADLVIVGERVEDGMKSGRLVDTHLLQTLTEQQSGTGTSQRRPAVKRQETSQKGGDVQRITTAPPFRRNFQQSQAAYVHPTATQSYTGPPQQFPQQGYAAPPAQGYPFPRARTTTRSSKRRRTSQLFSSPAKVKSLLHHA